MLFENAAFTSSGKDWAYRCHRYIPSTIPLIRLLLVFGTAILHKESTHFLIHKCQYDTLIHTLTSRSRIWCPVHQYMWAYLSQWWNSQSYKEHLWSICIQYCHHQSPVSYRELWKSLPAVINWKSYEWDLQRRWLLLESISSYMHTKGHSDYTWQHHQKS